MAKSDIQVDIHELEPVEALNPARLPKGVLDEYREAGRKVIKDNKYAVVIMAGGQRNKTTEMMIQKECLK
ncbi:MAG: hypothetical protein FWC79_05035 [Oscillospiraceae bacterium]|nr:hypothetical protein [Oscillospiraceae bacterium]